MKDPKRVELRNADEFTDKEINELADWLNSLTAKQMFFLKDSYEGFVAMNERDCECEYAQ